MNAENLAEGSWALVMFSGGWKFHYCPSEIVSDLVADIIARGGEEKEIKVVVEGRIDLPGMIMTDRPWESIKIGSFNLNIPSQDFSKFMIELASAPVRKFASGKEYYKIHSWRECVVFSPEQREMVLDVAEKMIDRDAYRKVRTAELHATLPARMIGGDLPKMNIGFWLKWRGWLELQLSKTYKCADDNLGMVSGTIE